MTAPSPCFASRPTSHRTWVPAWPASISLSRSTGRLPSQVRLDHGGVPHDFLRRPVRDLSAFINHDDAVGQGQDGPHHMLDDERAEPHFLLEAGGETPPPPAVGPR